MVPARPTPPIETEGRQRIPLPPEAPRARPLGEGSRSQHRGLQFPRHFLSFQYNSTAGGGAIQNRRIRRPLAEGDEVGYIGRRASENYDYSHRFFYLPRRGTLLRRCTCPADRGGG